MKRVKLLRIFVSIISSVVYSYILHTYKYQIIFSPFIPNIFNIRYRLWLIFKSSLIPYYLTKGSCGWPCFIDIMALVGLVIEITVFSLVVYILITVLNSNRRSLKIVLSGIGLIIIVMLLVVPPITQQVCIKIFQERERYYSIEGNRRPNTYYSDDYISRTGRIMLLYDYRTKFDISTIRNVVKSYGVKDVQQLTSSSFLLNVNPGDEFSVACNIPGGDARPQTLFEVQRQKN